MNDLIQSLCILGLCILSIVHTETERSFRRKINDLRRDNAALARWVIKKDPDLYWAWQKRNQPK